MPQIHRLKAEKIKNPSKSPLLKETENKNKYYTYIVVFLFSFILYGNTIKNEYALDDCMVITKNDFTQSGIKGIKNIFSYDSFKGFDERFLNGLSGGRYRPFSIATFAVEHEFFGNNPHISHFINVLLYSLTCLLIFILLTKLFEKYPRQKWHSSIPFIATILFAAHPIHTEVVANIKSRDEIFSLLFSLLTLWFMWKYLDSKRIIHLFYSSALFFLALISKEIAVVFILIIPLTFYFFTNHSLKEISKSIIPLLLIAIVFIIIRQTIIDRTSTDLIKIKDVLNDSFAEMNFNQKYATIMFTLGLYLKLLFFPHPLTWDYYPYHISIMEWSDFSVLLSLLIYLFLLFFAFRGLKNKNFFSFCIFLYLIPLSLTSNILFPVGVFMGERFLYASSLGFTLLISYLIVIKPNIFFKIIFNKPLFLLLPVLFLYSFKTITRNNAWKNDFMILQTDVETSYNSAKSNAEYGSELFHKAEKSMDKQEQIKYYDLALKHCEKAFKIDSNIQKVNYILGAVYCKYKNDYEKAIRYLNNSIILNPQHFNSYNNLGIAYGSVGKYYNSIEVFEKAYKLSPQNIEVLNNLGTTYAFIGKYDKAIEAFEKALEISPGNEQVLNNISIARKLAEEKSH
ncbi:MAG: tetratricopeptide repeat protein [Bacteroidales bacterium]|nr:tetratricopeptide repeat protein [Bacteroidales bacterium]